MKILLPMAVAAACLPMTGLAFAQSPPPSTMLRDAQDQVSAGRRAAGAPERNQLLSAPESAAAAGKSGRRYGPDLMAVIFAPVATIVAPINAGLAAFDAGVAPINEALRPITGPIGPAAPVADVPAPSAGASPAPRK